MTAQAGGPTISPLFDASAWRAVPGFSFGDITYHRAIESDTARSGTHRSGTHRSGTHRSGTVRIAFNRPEVRNAFRPQTVDELFAALDHARQSPDVGCVLLTGNGPSPRDGGWAF